MGIKSVTFSPLRPGRREPRAVKLWPLRDLTKPRHKFKDSRNRNRYWKNITRENQGPNLSAIRVDPISHLRTALPRGVLLIDGKNNSASEDPVTYPCQFECLAHGPGCSCNIRITGT